MDVSVSKVSGMSDLLGSPWALFLDFCGYTTNKVAEMIGLEGGLDLAI